MSPEYSVKQQKADEHGSGAQRTVCPQKFSSRDRVPDRNNCRGSSTLGIAEGIQFIMEGTHGSSGSGVHSGRRLKPRYISEDQGTESSRT